MPQEIQGPPDVPPAEVQAPSTPDRIRRYAIADEAAQLAVGELLEHLRDARLAQGFTQVELAARIGTSQRTVSMVEGGKQMPSMDTFVAHVLGRGGRIKLEFPDTDTANPTE